MQTNLVSLPRTRAVRVVAASKKNGQFLHLVGICKELFYRAHLTPELTSLSHLAAGKPQTKTKHVQNTDIFPSTVCELHNASTEKQIAPTAC